MSSVKEQLREAATRLFAKHGYANTSVAQICAEAGVSKGALYHHFDSKDAILYGIYQPLLELQIGRLQEIVQQPAPLIDRLFLVAEDVARTCLDPCRLPSRRSLQALGHRGPHAHGRRPVRSGRHTGEQRGHTACRTPGGFSGGALGRHPGHQPERGLPHHAPGLAGHEGCELGPHHQHGVGACAGGGSAVADLRSVMVVRQSRPEGMA